MEEPYTIDNILADACPSPSDERHPGYFDYHITLHCVEVTVTAKIINTGIFDKSAGDWLIPPAYHICRVVKRDRTT